jgi:hypothetical protein
MLSAENEAFVDDPRSVPRPHARARGDVTGGGTDDMVPPPFGLRELCHFTCARVGVPRLCE